MLGTFFLTVVFDLTVAVEVGIVLACALFIRRMSDLFSVELVSLQPPVLTYRLYGALFFGAAAKLDEAVSAVERAPRGMTVAIDALQLISIDATGLDALRNLHKAVLARGGVMRVDSLQAQPREVFERSGFAAFREPWLALHAYHGRRVRVMPGQDPAFDADVTDVGSDGALHVRADDGRLVPLASAEISLRAR
jgi:MFS superfamily sulfate permease-like transporter